MNAVARSGVYPSDPRSMLAVTIRSVSIAALSDSASIMLRVNRPAPVRSTTVIAT
ncbi:MAG TPA: hypothetical protein VF339_15425 [Gammaproteobacteria bacterium]